MSVVVVAPTRRTTQQSSAASPRHRCRRLPLLLAAALSSAAALSPTASAATTNVVQQKLYGLTSGLAYYMQLHIGQPLYSSTTASTATNKFRLLVDTGSANTAVVTADCCALTNTALYSCAASSTCSPQASSVSVSYITGAWTGALVTDTLSGDGLGDAIANAAVAAIATESNFVQTGYDGIVGLGYKAIASPTSDPPLPYFDTIVSAKNLPNVFSMLLCGALQSLPLSSSTVILSTAVDTDNAASPLYAGELVLGGIDGVQGERYYTGELVYVPLVQAKWFNVILMDVRVNGASLGLDCKLINTPRSIVDSGTSNIAFPPAVFSAILTQLKQDVRQIFPTAADSFFSDDVPCCSAVCDPTDASSIIYKLPPLALSLAVEGDTNEMVTITIPPEFIWRPILLQTTAGNTIACRVFGISEGDITLLGDVFMDGLYTVHDRDAQRIGFGVATACPNNVTSSKRVTLEAVPKGTSLCDCVSDNDRKKSLLSSYWPFSSSKPCFFWQWWMYVVVVCGALIVIAIGIVVYLAIRRRKLMKVLQSTRQQQQQRLPRREAPDGELASNLLTPSARAAAIEDDDDAVGGGGGGRETLPATTAIATAQHPRHNVVDSVV